MSVVGNVKRRKDGMLPPFTWMYLEELQLAYMQTVSQIDGSSKVVALDLDDTMVAVRSTKRHPGSAEDWKWWHESVPRQLRRFAASGHKIVVFTNQGGINGYGYKQQRETILLGRIEQVLRSLDVPAQVFVACAYDRWRKPSPDMWNLFADEYNNDVTLNLNECVYVGDAAGRVASTTRKKDHSDSDLMFARNAKINFLTPEQFFLEVEMEPTGGIVCDVGDAKRSAKRGTIDAMFGAPAAAAGENPDNGTADNAISSTNVISFAEQDGTPHTLVFPPLSVGVGKFDVRRAATVLAEAIVAFFKRHSSETFRLVLLSDNVDIVRDFKQVYEQHKSSTRGDIADNFAAVLGSIACPSTAIGARCRALVNEANWRLSAKGGGVNRVIHSAAGEHLAKATAAKYAATAPVPSQAYPVRLPRASPLFKEQGVEHIVHVVAPNCDANKPNYVSDKTEACRMLRAAYDNVFDAFVSALTDDSSEKRPSSASSTLNVASFSAARAPAATTSTTSGIDAFNVLMQGAKRPASSESSAAPKKMARSTADKKFDGWAFKLDAYCTHPERNKEAVVYADDECVVIRDLYAKARVHLLVMPRALAHIGAPELGAEHLPLVRTLLQRAETEATNRSLRVVRADELQSCAPSSSVRIGFHAVPSMRQLHLHVISQDLGGVALKRRQHWMSFTTDFFIDANRAIRALESVGTLDIDEEAYEAAVKSEPMRCHLCSTTISQIPALKTHVATCVAQFDQKNSN